MRWTLTLKGAEQDIARLVDVLPDDVAAVEGDPYRAAVTLVDPEGGATGDAGREAARASCAGAARTQASHPRALRA